jgi:hypothetical protein
LVNRSSTPVKPSTAMPIPASVASISWVERVTSAAGGTPSRRAVVTT